MRCIIWHTTDIGEGIDLEGTVEGITEGEGGRLARRKSNTSLVNQSDNPRASVNKGTHDLGNMTDLIESGHEVLTDMYEDTFSEDTRMILDPIIDSIPIIGAGRDMMDEFVERKDYLEKTGISYDDVVDKQNWNRGISRNIESISGQVTRFAPRGSKSIQDVYSR